MDIKNRLYPYPVLSPTSDDYLFSDFNFKVESDTLGHNVEFIIELKLENDELQALINEEKAEFVIHIECPQTCFREIYRDSKKSFVIKIPDKQIKGKVSVCAFIVAKENLPKYGNSKFNPDYKDLTFQVNKGSILAIAGQYNIIIQKDIEELTKIPSIFSICKYGADSEESLIVNLDNDKIIIGLSEENFLKYNSLANMPGILPVFHSMFIFPALIFTFETLKAEGVEAFETRRWYSVIKETLKKYKIDIDSDMFENIPSFTLAQKLLENPVERSLGAIETVIQEDEE